MIALVIIIVVLGLIGAGLIIWSRKTAEQKRIEGIKNKFDASYNEAKKYFDLANLMLQKGYTDAKKAIDLFDTGEVGLQFTYRTEYGWNGFITKWDAVKNQINDILQKIDQDERLLNYAVKMCAGMPNVTKDGIELKDAIINTIFFDGRTMFITVTEVFDKMFDQIQKLNSMVANKNLIGLKEQMSLTSNTINDYNKIMDSARQTISDDANKTVKGKNAFDAKNTLLQSAGNMLATIGISEESKTALTSFIDNLKADVYVLAPVSRVEIISNYQKISYAQIDHDQLIKKAAGEAKTSVYTKKTAPARAIRDMHANSNHNNNRSFVQQRIAESRNYRSNNITNNIIVEDDNVVFDDDDNILPTALAVSMIATDLIDNNNSQTVFQDQPQVFGGGDFGGGGASGSWQEDSYQDTISNDQDY